MGIPHDQLKKEANKEESLIDLHGILVPAEIGQPLLYCPTQGDPEIRWKREVL